MSQAPTSSGLKIPPDARFRPIRLHAIGGLGLVHAAWDRQLGRVVALKEMRPNVVNDRALRERFLREAEINGNLEHPGIVPVYALGADEEDRPYYAMRFVEGQTLHAALLDFHERAARLSASQWTIELRRLLDALLDVCQAIAYAHSRAVLHRDLKPGNVMLGKFGETHIIDWGLAKATGQAVKGVGEADDSPAPVVAFSSGGDSSQSVAGHAIGSPPYMSPEQARGEIDRLGPATDVYSLGATLYAIMTGKPPADGKDTAEILEKVRAGRIASPRSVNERIPQALEAICQRAMRLEPDDRYASAAELAADLRHWLADEPVAVHQDSATTRLLRWSRHHKTLVGVAGGLILATLVALAGTTLLVNQQKQRERGINSKLAIALRETEQARDEARTGRLTTEVARDALAVALQQTEEARDAAEAHIRLGLDVVDQLVTLGDRQIMSPPLAGQARQDLLEQALEFLRAFRQRVPDDTAVLVDSATAARRLGHLYTLIGRLDQAAPFLEESAALNASLAGEEPDDLRHGDRQAEALLDLAELKAVRGQVEEAESGLREVLAGARFRVERDPESAIYQRTLGRGLTRLAAVLLLRGQGQEAFEAASEATELLGKLAEGGQAGLRRNVEENRLIPFLDQLEASNAVSFRGQALAALGRREEAQSTLRGGLGQLSKVSRILDGMSLIDLDYFHASLEIVLAQVLLKDEGTALFQAFEAGLHLDAAIGLLEPLARRFPEYVHFQDSLAEALATRAEARLATNQKAGAGEDALAARKLLEKRLEGSASRLPSLTSLLGLALEGQARALMGDDEGDEARELLEQALEVQDEALSLCPQNPVYLGRRRQHLEAVEGLQGSARP